VTQPAPRPVYVQRRPAPRRKSSRTGIIIAVVVIIVIVLALALFALSASSSASNGNVYEPVGYVQPGVYPPQGGYPHTPVYYS